MRNVIEALMKVIIGIIVFAGLPILGWGIGDIQGFIAEPARRLFLIIIVALQMVAVIMFPNIEQGRSKGKNPVKRQISTLAILQILTLGVVLISAITDRFGFYMIGNIWYFRCAGLIIFPAGFILMLWSESHLGKQFSLEVTIQEGHELITDGPYRFIRHPRYLGIIIFMLGISLVFCSLAGILLVSLISIVLLGRIKDEEDLLSKEFPEKWSAYKTRSWRLFPFLY
ncbi:MAG TPA: isoprenylcysteine carboxylmethyltransferase family protein [Candidatus Omnitrophota bacterium]|nr:isoprenylcysteine carboxylmethyltransferase family protein [Candidatus Omnitrophota bacterium]HPS21146.1 isoprenylcysteine carboxylmethyltransferase family protein [Candidatus Omnitrophota bacterium]